MVELAPPRGGGGQKPRSRPYSLKLRGEVDEEQNMMKIWLCKYYYKIL
jgi:hypothetical protein